MKFSKSWVDEDPGCNPSADALAEQITMAGLEVDVARGRGRRVFECGRWRSAECVSIRMPTSCGRTKVNVGGGRATGYCLWQAPNCRCGLRVAVAKAGAKAARRF